MKELFILLIALITTTLSFGQTIVYQETFETPANGVNYNTLVSEFTDLAGDFFIRTNGSNIGSDYEVTGQEGSFYFAAQDLDGEPPNQDTISFFTIPIDVSGLTDLRVKFLLAEDDEGFNEDWDLADHFRVYASVFNDGEMGSGEVLVFAVEDQGAEFNTEPLVDTDFDGVGDGVPITSVFTEHMASIPGTGDLLAIRIEFSLNAGDEDIAIDNIRVTGIAPCTPPPTCNLSNINVESCDIPTAFTNPEDVFTGLEACGMTITMTHNDVGDTDVCGDGNEASFTRTYTLLYNGSAFTTCIQTITIGYTAPIPTLSQWGIIILGLGFFLIGIIAIRATRRMLTKEFFY